MSTKMPRDGNSQPIPVLAQGTVNNGFSSGTAFLVALPAGSKVVRISAIEDTYIEFGDSSVVVGPTTGSLITGGSTADFATGDATHVSHIRVSTGGIVSITDMV